MDLIDTTVDLDTSAGLDESTRVIPSAELATTTAQNAAAELANTAGTNTLSGGAMPVGLLLGKNSFCGLPIPNDFLSRYL